LATDPFDLLAIFEGTAFYLSSSEQISARRWAFVMVVCPSFVNIHIPLYKIFSITRFDGF
jgi:hypothetical protein